MLAPTFANRRLKIFTVIYFDFLSIQMDDIEILKNESTKILLVAMQAKVPT